MANKSKYQKFIVETINRSQLKNADYNPRIIDEDNKKKLKKMLKKEGLVSPITWNKRTGNIVSGHQRINILDSLERTQDYNLDVAVIDVDEREEKALNVQMNNPEMQGDWDLNKLADLNLNMGVDFDDMGFDQTDVDFMFGGDERFSELYDTPEVEAEKNKLEEVKEAREESKEKLKDKNNINFYDMIVFKDEKERKEFHKLISVPEYEDKLSFNQLKRLKGADI